MYSPKERLYNTPDMGAAVLQQLRLETILRKYGRLACCEPYVYSSKPLTRKLPELKPPLRALRPFDDQRPPPDKSRRHTDNQSKTLTERSERPDLRGRDFLEDRANRNKRSEIFGVPPNDPYLQRPRDYIGGCKYGGPTLSGKDKRTAQEIFKPFCPQKSPRRLPCIQREKPKCPQTVTLVNPTDSELAHHINILNKQQSHELAKLKYKEKKRRKKKVRLEQEFHQWEQSQDSYLHGVHSLESDHQILTGLEKLHDAGNQPQQQRAGDAEQAQRTRISDEIKRGVQRKMELFRHDDERTRERFVPICNMTFDKQTDVYYQEKTTVTDDTKSKSRKKHTEDNC